MAPGIFESPQARSTPAPRNLGEMGRMLEEEDIKERESRIGGGISKPKAIGEIRVKRERVEEPPKSGETSEEIPGDLRVRL